MTRFEQTGAMRWLRMVLLMVAAACTNPALAQDAWEYEEEPDDYEMYLGGETRRYRPAVTRSDLLFFARMVRLERGQREAILELHTSYSQRYEEAATKMQEYEDAISDGDQDRLYSDGEITKLVEPVRTDFHKHLEALKEELITDVKMVLTEEEQGKWEWFEWRTEMRGTWGLGLNGRTVPDLGELTHRALRSEAVSDEVLQTLARYYADLVALNKQLKDLQQEWAREDREKAPVVDGEDDVEEEGEAAPDPAMEARGAKTKELQTKALEVTQRSASKIQGLLPPGAAERFEDRYLSEMASQSGFQDRMFSTDRAFAKALGVKSLSDEQRAAVLAIESEVIRERAVRQRAALADLIAGKNKDTPQNEMKAMMEYQRIITTQKSTLTKIRGVLTPEQQAEAGSPVLKASRKLPDFDAEEEAAPEMPKRVDWMPDMEGYFTAGAVTDLDLAFLKRAAPLTDDQYEAAKDLFATYTTRSRNAGKKVAAFQQSMSERMAEGETPDFFDKSLIRVFVKYEQYRKRIKVELLRDLESLLTEEQSAAYDAIKRRVKRSALGSRNVQANVRGSRVDLVNVTESVFIDAEVPEDVRAVLDRYETDAAPPIDRLNAYEEQEIKRMAKMAEGGGALDAGDLMGFFNNSETQAEKLLVEVRDRNMSCFRELLPKMPEAQKAAFELQFYILADPFGPMSWMGRSSGRGRTPAGLLAEAKHLGDLTPEQTEALSKLSREHTDREVSLRREFFEQQLKAEDLEKGRAERMQNFDYQALYARQRELGESSKQTVTRMIEVLTESQRDRLPKAYRPMERIERPRFGEE